MSASFKHHGFCANSQRVVALTGSLYGAVPVADALFADVVGHVGQTVETTVRVTLPTRTPVAVPDL